MNNDALALAGKFILASTTGDDNELQRISAALAAELTKEKTDDTTPPALNKDITGFLNFTNKEISKMPKAFRHTFIAEGKIICYRKRKRGKVSCSYEARYRRHGYNISVSAQNLIDLKQRFIEALHAAELGEALPKIPTNFHEFAMYWFENFHKAKVKEKTFKNNLNMYKRHIKPTLENYRLKTITPSMLKNLLSSLPGNGKTADEIHSILNQIFETALTHKVLEVNPLVYFVHLQHERESGVELTFEEENKLLSACEGTDYKVIFAVILYCGLRPNEYNTARIDSNFIVAINSKQKNGKIEYKKIPICSHLRAILKDLTKLPTRHEVGMRDKFNSILSGHTLKDLRKTFNTRCIECKVETFARKKFMGHSVGKLDKTYTGSLENYLLSEGAKLNQWYTPPEIAPN